ncbi:UNVERIFIED_CONTAM: hypothetical protein C7454_106178 [Acidovorax defluvii]|jgi:predicted Na+-dependent transporter
MQGDIVSGVLLPLILAFIMFSLGLGLTVGDFRRIFTQPRALLVGWCATSCCCRWRAFCSSVPGA